jgi:selenocysteine lyase/cysteine desulfurase
VQQCRNALNDYFDGFGAERVIFTKNCTEALNIALFGVLEQNDHVVVSCMEHNSVLRPLEALRKADVITYDVCPLRGDVKDGNANIDPADIQKLLRPNTKMVIVTTASNVNGAIPPLDKIKTVLPKKTLFLCDGAQGGGHIPLKMKETGVDLLTLAGHKGMMGIQGSGALLFSDRVQPKPLLHGGTGSSSFSLDMPDFYPDCLEAGTLSYPAVLSLLEGTRYLSAREKKIHSRCFMLSTYFLNGLHAIDGYQSYSRPNPCGIVAFSHHSLPSEYVADLLSTQYDVAVRGGLHCAPLAHTFLGTEKDGLVRASIAVQNSSRELNYFISAIKRIAETKFS